MKKYLVEAAQVNGAMVKGFEPWNTITMATCEEYVEAESEAEAIELVIEYIKENICNEIYSEGEDEIFFVVDGDIYGYKFFTAKEV